MIDVSTENSNNEQSKEDLLRRGRKIIKESVEAKTADPGEANPDAPAGED